MTDNRAKKLMIGFMQVVQCSRISRVIRYWLTWWWFTDS